MSIEKVKSGSYRVRYRIGSKQYSKNFRRKVDAKAFEDKIKRGDGSTPPIFLKKLSFLDLCNEYINRHGKVFKAASSVDEDLSIISRHLIPAFGKYPLATLILNPRIIEDERNRLKATGLANKTINNIFTLAHRIFSLAVKWRYLPTNPCAGLGRLKMEQNEMLFWSFEERDNFLAYAEKNDSLLFEVTALLVYTGMRIGELRGLKRDCLDFTNNAILIKRSYCSRSNQLLERTKSYMSRRVPMNSVVRSVLLKHALIPAESAVLPTFDRSNFAKRHFYPAVKKSGVTRIRLHDLRHTFASHLAILGVDVMRIKKLMGHSDLGVTQKYMHLSPSATDGITERLLEGCVRNVSDLSGETLGGSPSLLQVSENAEVLKRTLSDSNARPSGSKLVFMFSEKLAK